MWKLYCFLLMAFVLSLYLVVSTYPGATMIDYKLLKNELKRDEGFSAKPYYDTKGNLTIGYGKNLETGISKFIADIQLGEDIANIEEWLSEYSWWESVNPVRKRALINMGMMGQGSFSSFIKMIRAIELDQWGLVAVEALDSDWAKDVGSRRSTTISEMLRTGD